MDDLTIIRGTLYSYMGEMQGRLVPRQLICLRTLIVMVARRAAVSAPDTLRYGIAALGGTLAAVGLWNAVPSLNILPNIVCTMLMSQPMASFLPSFCCR